MGRNYFSKHGGPYFINDGYSGHLPNPNPIKPSPEELFIAIGFLSLIVTIVTVLIVL